MAAGPVFLTLGTTDSLDGEDVAAFRQLALHVLHLPAVSERLSNARYRELSERFRPLMEATGLVVKESPRELNLDTTDDTGHVLLWRDCFQKLLAGFGTPAPPEGDVPFAPPVDLSSRFQRCLRAFNEARPAQLKPLWMLANYWSPWGKRIVSANINAPPGVAGDASGRWQRAWNLFLALTLACDDKSLSDAVQPAHTTYVKYLFELHGGGEVLRPVEWRLGFVDTRAVVRQALEQAADGGPEGDYARVVLAPAAST